MSILSSTKEDLSTIIRSKKLYIPKYQRSYAWEKDHCEDLWNDLCFLVNDNNSMHFYGQIVVHIDRTDNEKRYIIDGQQRITSSYLLIRAFLKWYDSIKYRNQESLEAKCLARKGYDIENLIGYSSIKTYMNQNLNLVQNEEDNEYFVKLICLEPDALSQRFADSASGRNLMKNAFKYFDGQVRNLLRDAHTNEEKEGILDTYFTAFIKKFEVMYLEDDDLNEAYTIFETLNDRGKDLASSDLLKNYMLANSVDANNSYKKWEAIKTNLDGVDLTKYVRDVWNSEHSFTRDKALYGNITKELNRSASRCDDFLEDLKNCSLFYHDTFVPDSTKLISDEIFLQTMRALKTMNSSTWRPVLISMYKKKSSNGKKVYSFEDMNKVAKVIETFVFKNFVICGNNPNSAETDFANLAKNIALKPTTTEDIVKSINEMIVDDDVFSSGFKARVFSDNEGEKEKIRYFFRKIHKHLDRNKEININNSEVHIEHIMPQDISQWSDVDDQTYEKYLWSLGNLCLLSGPLNQEISNKPFTFKKENAYENSDIQPNKELCKYEVWNKDSIEDRLSKLLELAKKIWK